MKPPPGKSLMDDSFRYTSSASTDLRKTFARVRKELALKERVERSAERTNITPLKRA